jgi:hypothetical protein
MRALKRLSRTSVLAIAMSAVFIALQLLTLDYGTRVNDLPYIREYKVAPGVTAGSSLDRETIVAAQGVRAESLDLWMVRFKLYTIDADEVYSVMALARIRPAQLQFDPHYYQYGGAFLYPLGAYYFALSKLGVVSIGSLDTMLSDPQRIDRIWIAGRAFILAITALAGLLLFFALRYVASPPVALAGLAIFYFCPATIMFSQVLKPHWYALLFANTALLLGARAAVKGTLSLRSQIVLGAALGLAVGSAITFGLFAVLVWGGLVYLVATRRAPVAALVLVPAVALVALLLTNPYYLLNWPAMRGERAVVATWFAPSFEPQTVAQFFVTSIMAGFGICTTLVFAYALVRQFARPATLGVRLFGLGVVVPLAIMAVMLAGYSYWHSNFRYLPYALPLMILFLTRADWPYKRVAITLTAVASILQAAPLKLAYFDENSVTHSTRLTSAAWIDAHVPASDPVCIWTGTPAPFSLPPFRFDRYTVVTPEGDTSRCRWLIVLDGNQDPKPTGPGWTLAQAFGPRLSPHAFPLVWEHINPRVAVYGKTR